MNNIIVDATHCTPLIDFRTEGRLLIEGRSLPENVNKFFVPLIEWVKKLTVRTVKLDINLEYFNSASSKKILELLKCLDANNSIEEFIVNWHYEEGDEDALESGQIFEDLLRKAKFRYQKYAEAA